LFGKANGLYDFSGDMNVLLERRKELQDAQNGRKKKINHKVMNVIESYVSFPPSQHDRTG
jgi:structural maintenance of chromosome 2